MTVTGLLGSQVVTTVTGIPCTFCTREKVAIPKIVITFVALYICVRAGVYVCVCVRVRVN
jgi:hypothetical protein